jgi:outer membrane lipoprotein LolB
MSPRTALVGAALVLVGCAHTVLVDDQLGYERRQSQLEAISDWSIDGRLTVDTGERGYQARFSWQQHDGELELLVRGLLGARSFRIEGDETRLTVQSRGETEVLTDPELQLSEMLGWWLPVTSVEHWLLGRPDPGYPADTARGAFDTLSMLNQREWAIRYEEYQLADGRLIPRHIVLSDAPLTLQLFVTDWESAADAP